ncbi:MAG: SurA N-terminal domain-containing protein [Desulfobacterales bacterium]|nr:SurA N-terminal domain-containing protein [Desulfobacterales bacterium]
MLSTMRKSAGSWMIKILLGLIVLAFVFTGAGSFYSQRETTVAEVNGEPITIDEYQRTHNNIMQNLEQRFGNQLNQDLLDMLDIRGQALNQLIEKHLLLQVAEQKNLRVPDDALATAIAEIPAFQNNGGFDARRYRQLLEQNRLSPKDFENLHKQTLQTSMIRNLVSGAVPVSEVETRAWHNWQNTEIKIDYAEFSGSDFTEIEVSEEEIREYFDANKEKYRTQPSVQARFLRFDPADFIDEVEISKSEIRDYYQAHQDEFGTPETVTARHILLQVPENAEKDKDSEIRNRAAQIMEKARNGEDFAALAEKHSDGPTAKDGGYLGSFKRDDMVEAFAEAAFSLKPGEISEPVRTRFGWHVIKVEQRQEAEVEPLEKVREKIRTRLAEQKTRTIAYDKAWSLYEISFEGDDLIDNARDLNLNIETTDFFTREKGPADIDAPGTFAETAFDIPLMEISEVKEIGDAYFLIQPIERKEPEIPDLQDIKDRVENDLVRQKQREAAESAAEKFLAKARSADSFDDAAREAGVEIQTTDFFKRNQPVPDIGNSRPVSAAAFSLSPKNPVSESVIKEGGRFFVLHLRGQKVPDEKDFESQQKTAAAQLREQKREQTLNKWIAALRQNSDIEVSDRFSGEFEQKRR